MHFLKEGKVVINLTERRSKTRRDGFNCEHKFFYDSLPKNKVGDGLISTPELQLNFPELQTTKQMDARDYTVGAQTTHALIPMRK